MDEVLSAFLAECHENLEKLDNEIVFLEKDPEGSYTQDSLAKIFRTVHTIKGSCGWLGLSKLEAVVHDGEELLVALREENVPLTTEIVSTLLEMFDAIREILLNIKNTEQEGNTDYSLLIQKLKNLLSNPHCDTNTEILDPVTISLPTTKPSTDIMPQEKSTLNMNNNLSEGNIRVDVNVLDKLMNLVGELVLTRNQILRIEHLQKDTGFSATAQHLNLLTTELQASVMKTRMQMISVVWNKFPRVVRDLALDCGKQINVEMDGQETELDRTIVEAIKDPLTHIVRNAVDHGIESTEERVAAGKNPIGTLSLQAYHEGGHVNISISDDGKGLNPEFIKEKALQKGLITAAEAQSFNERSILNLIFSPGFSTAQKVTNISGRGVGMDVVKTNIEEVGGFVEVYSKPGQGTRFKIKIPLTLAIIPALMIQSAHECFAIPQMNLLELVSLEGDQVQTKIEMLYNTPIYRLRGDILPLLCLKKELNLGSFFEEREAAIKADDISQMQMNIIVLQADEQKFGLIVDEISDTEEIVVKPLSKQLKSLSVYAGATILGTGKVALILDIMGLAKQAKLLSEEQQLKIAKADNNLQEKQFERHSLLMFKATQNRTMSLPISKVSRLEEFHQSDIQSTGELQIIRYSKKILPLIFLSDVFSSLKQVPLPAAAELLPVIVCSVNNNHVGLVVHEILDIVETDENFEIQYSIKREGVLGSIILSDNVMDILDFKAIVLRKLPEFFDDHANKIALAAVR